MLATHGGAHVHTHTLPQQMPTSTELAKKVTRCSVWLTKMWMKSSGLARLAGWPKGVSCRQWPRQREVMTCEVYSGSSVISRLPYLTR